jgi:death-on-curing protein
MSQYRITHEAQKQSTPSESPSGPEAEGSPQPMGDIRGQESSPPPNGNEATGLEPVFPTVEDATAVNQQSLTDFGQTNHALLRPEVLAGALARPQQHWAYGEEQDPQERLVTAAAKLAHGVGQAQAFEDGNKRTAYHLTHGFLDFNGLGHLIPDDDDELAQHIVGYGEGTHSMDDTINMLKARLNPPPPPGDTTPGRVSNILDPVHEELDPAVWDAPDQPNPRLKASHHQFIHDVVYTALEKHDYTGAEHWLSLVFTGSLTTYQYADHSDCDISLFVDSDNLPEWSRAEMIGIMIEAAEGLNLPGTTHEMQFYVVARGLKKTDLYKPGLRSGYDLQTDTWIVPPDRTHVHDVEHEMNEAYTIALENADKMEKLLRYEPEKAVMFYKQLHKRRLRDQTAGKGDFSPSNISYKMMANRGLFDALRGLGLQIA